MTTVSFEFFPPKTDAMEAQLWETVQRLEGLSPTFVSVTYGAGGSTRERTHRTVKRLIEETSLAPAAHLTCVGATADEVDEVLRDYWAAGVRHIVALRGDPPGGLGLKFQTHPGGYAGGADVAAAARRVGAFEISVGVYPEKHPDSPTESFDLDILRKKIDAGASRGISQFFLEPATFLRFRDAVARAGLRIEIVPGIMPVGSVAGLKKMAAGCGASVPTRIAAQLDGLDADPPVRSLVAASLAVDLCQSLQREGVSHFHFYTLNKADLTLAVCRRLGLKPAAALVKDAAA
jgi:methylenetetrahydrofolate reductase (NADPH)